LLILGSADSMSSADPADLPIPGSADSADSADQLIRLILPIS
jgi:hypothetical protein